MFIFEVKNPKSHFGPLFPPRKVFDRIYKELGPYQGLFYQNNHLILHSPPMKGIWPEIAHGQSWGNFLDYLRQIISQGERTHFAEFLKLQENLSKPLCNKFILTPGVLKDFSFLGIYIHPTPYGYHIALTPSSGRGEIETLNQKYTNLDLDPLFAHMSLWIREMETELLVSEAIRSIPDPFLQETSFHRFTEYLSTEGTRESVQLIYRESNGVWVRDLLVDEKATPNGRASRIQAKLENGDILMKITFFVGQIFPIFWATIPYRSLEQHSLEQFYGFVRSFSDQSVVIAQDFLSVPFQFSKHWTGHGYEMKSLESIAELFSEDPMNVPVIPIWGLTSDTLEIIRKTSRLSDPIFLDWHKGLAAILLRDCSLEDAQTIVFKNLSRRIKLPIEPPTTVEQFLHTD
ncbi:MAG: hypothetical protein ACYCYP_11475 [Leptospirales bacterium]